MEGLRLHPRLTGTVKAAVGEGAITLHTVEPKTAQKGAPVQVSVGKGTHLIFDIVAINLNRKSIERLLTVAACRLNALRARFAQPSRGARTQPSSGQSTSSTPPITSGQGKLNSSSVLALACGHLTCLARRDALLSFNAGLRGCIGRPAAIAEGTAVLATILSKFMVAPPAGQEHKWKLGPNETEYDRIERVYPVRWTEKAQCRAS